MDKLAIIGAGVMGTKVTWACVSNGLEVNLFDTSASQLAKSVARIETWLSDDRYSSTDAATVTARLHCHHELETALSGVDLAFENVPEDLDLKSAVLAKINHALAPAALIGSNTSSIIASKLAGPSGRPQLFFNMNFTDPRKGRLVEIMGSPDTVPETIHKAEAWARRIGMVPILTRKEIIGYTFNRIWRAIKKECLYLADQGYADPQDIDRAFMLTFGTPMGPFGMMDDIGLNSIKLVEEKYFEASGDPGDRPPRILTDLVTAGQLGIQSGRGFYDYPNPAYELAGWLEGREERMDD